MMDGSHFTGQPRLGKHAPRTPVFRVVTTEPRQFIIYSAAIWGQKIHFFKGRSVECKEDTGRCQHCVDSIPQKWKGYIHCHNIHSGERLFLELTETACNMLERMAPSGENLRGLQLRVSKTKGGAKGRYILEFLPRRMDELDLVPEEDPRDTLRFLWACKNQNVKDA